MSNMVELDKAVSPIKIEKMYKEGSKVGICFNEDTYIDAFECILRDSEHFVEGLIDVDNIECKEGFFVKGKELYIKANSIIVIEEVKIESDITESFFVVHPFKGVNAECYSEFYIYRDPDEDLNIADKVFKIV